MAVVALKRLKDLCLGLMIAIWQIRLLCLILLICLIRTLYKDLFRINNIIECFELWGRKSRLFVLLCMYISVFHICVYLHTFIHAYICIDLHVHIYTPVYLYVCTHIF